MSVVAGGKRTKKRPLPAFRLTMPDVVGKTLMKLIEGIEEKGVTRLRKGMSVRSTTCSSYATHRLATIRDGPAVHLTYFQKGLKILKEPTGTKEHNNLQLQKMPPGCRARGREPIKM